MNLIDQLGGYEAAKNYLAELQKIPMHEQTEDTIVSLPRELLEYRREHNIFEVGDFVLPVSDEFSNEVCELTEDYIGQDFKYRTKRGGFGYIVKSFMTTAWRHATDEEIANNARSK